MQYRTEELIIMTQEILDAYKVWYKHKMHHCGYMVKWAFSPVKRCNFCQVPFKVGDDCIKVKWQTNCKVIYHESCWNRVKPKYPKLPV